MGKSTPVTIRAEFRFDDSAQEWIATSLEYAKLQARGIDMRQARLRLEDLLRGQLKRDVEVEAKLMLPRSLAQAVEAYGRDLDALDALSRKCEEGRLPLAKRLLIEGRLSQKEVAKLLRISGTWLGQQLKMESGTFERGPREDTHSRERRRAR